VRRAADQKTLWISGVSARLRAGGRDVSAAQFLLLMADASAEAAVSVELTVRQVFPFSAVGESFPGTRPLQHRGTTWTLKPAP